MALLSHELRMPLTPIPVAAQMLEEDPEYREHAREQVSMIRRNATLEARLIEDLLDVTRINCGRLQIKHDNVSLHDAIQAAVEACWPETREKQLILSSNLLATQEVVNGDAARLQQAIWNIVRHCVRCMPSKGTITVQTENAGAGRVRVLIPGYRPGSFGRRDAGSVPAVRRGWGDR